MRALVAVASKHGATREIAEAIGEVLDDHGIRSEVMAAADVASVDGYDGVVIGSAVYAGRWLDAARTLVEEAEDCLHERPVWLFSSGPLGTPPKPEGDPVDVADMLERSGSREHRVFAGKLDRSRLGFGEKAIVVALRAPEGDFRDWDAIRAWAAEIAATIRAAEPV